MKKISLLLFLLSPFFFFAQINDDFEDGDILGWTEGIVGHWIASNETPINGSYSLKHNLSDIESTSYITADISETLIENGESVWQFNLKNGNWDPSSSNYFGVFLFSDTEDLSSNLNGYAVGINMSGTSDLMSLWRVSNGSYNSIIESAFDWNSAETIGIQVTRSASGDWSLEYDTNGNFDNLVLGGNATDNTHTNALFTGVWFEYTATRAGELWIDDFSFTGPADTNPPTITNVSAISNNTILVNFNENLQESSAETITNYIVDEGIGNPNSATLNTTDNTQVELIFTNTFTEDIQYLLTVNNVEDLSGNPTINEEATFTYFIPEPINDDFEDGDITNWTESTAARWGASGNLPINGNFSLHHTYENDDAGHDQISIPSSAYNINSQKTIWRFQLKYGYTPSSSNNWSCFLFSDQDAANMHPGGNANAYALGVNYTGSDDTLRLWKISSGSAAEIINTGINWENDIGVSDIIGFEVQRTTEGEWSVYVDFDGGFSDLVMSGTSVIDNEFSLNEHLGFYYEYSSSQDQQLWIDDVYMGEEIPDTIKPYIVNIEKIDENNIAVTFNEFVEESSAENTSNYSVDQGIGNPTDAILNAENNKLVELTFANSFSDDINYILSVSNVQDLNANTSDTFYQFNFYEVDTFDIVINEIMCDINPIPAGLPEREFLEIYNTSQFDINLGNWTIIIGDDESTIPNVVIPASSYAIICESSAESEFQEFGITIPILNSSELTVSGKRIQIKETNGITIEDLTYSDEWYDDPEKDDGGWSLERIDYNNFCGENDNWTVSGDPRGGTPGIENYVYETNPDISAPEAVSIEYISSKQINVHFSENVNKEIAENTDNYVLNISTNPVSALLSPEMNSVIMLQFAENFAIGNNTLSIENIEDNCSNIMSEYTGSFEYQLIYPLTVDVDPGGKQLMLRFSEKVDSMSATNQTNFTVNEGIGSPVSVSINNYDNSIIHLVFEEQFVLEQNYVLRVENVEDVNQNTIVTADLDFVYYKAKPFDIVFTEIMADVNPEPVGLPAEQYIEIYNTSNFSINLSDWTFESEGQSEKTLPYLRLDAQSYALLCESSAEQYFLPYGNTVPILGSSDITVSGKNIKLKKTDGTIINEINYSDDWYDDENYDDGAWSLEIIDPLNFCGENDNWTVSIDPSGGTPGRENSVNASNPDNTAPELIAVKIIASNYLLLEFDENISEESSSIEANFIIDNTIGNPDSSILDTEDRKKVHLQFSQEFQDEESYELVIENLEDNCGNIIDDTGFDFIYQRIYPQSVVVVNENSLKIDFSEAVEYASGTNLTNYICTNDLGNPIFVFRETADSSIVHLQFGDAFPNGEELTLSIQNIEDINGNSMNDAEFSFVYYVPVYNDLVINEVLFNPYKDGSDFVEIYNRSEYPIDLKNIYLAKRIDIDSINSQSQLSEIDFIIEPSTYLAFTDNKENILRDYLSQNHENMLEIKDIPSYSDDEGTVVLIHKNDSIIDEFTYNEDMHFRLLDDNEGVSLERVNFEMPSNELSNWHSASENVGFATPAYKNSQFREAENYDSETITVDPKVFSPDNDGFDDYANIIYRFSNQGNVATVIIFDSKGRPVVELANNMSVSTEGTIVWDGLYQDDRLAPAGTYIVYFEVYNINGSVNVYKKALVLAKKI
jgi:hypothetical protein